MMTACTASSLLSTARVTVYFGPVELRNFDRADEGLILHPHPRFRLSTNTNATPVPNYFFTDGLGTVRVALDAAGARVENHSFTPWGEKTPWLTATQTLPETKGWIGERYDEDAGLQYLNARYYDPKLGLFIQPDWFEVRQRGVGTKRYSYSFNEPVNMLDPNGNAAIYADINGDGFNTYVGQVSPTDPAYYSDRGSDWIAAAERNRTFQAATGFSTRNEATQVHALAQKYGVGTVVGGNISPSGIVTIYTSNSPLTQHVFSPSGVLQSSARLNPAGAAIGTAVVAAEALGRARMNITYISYGPGGRVYLGRASGWMKTPEQVLQERWSVHHMAGLGFGNPVVDRFTTGEYGSFNWAAIRGREQQLIDSFGGIGSPMVANRIRGVSASNYLGRGYHAASNARFGNLAPYTGR